MLVKDPQTGQIVIDRTPTRIRYIDTGKVKIGCAYLPKPARMTRDEETIQSLMLGYKIPGRFGATLHWLYLALVLLAVFCVSAAAK